MDNAKQVNKDYSIAGQPTAEDLKTAAKQGFKSVLNLRSPGEPNSLADEQQQAEAAGLQYETVPLQPNAADDALVSKALDLLDDLPKPVLIHCAAGARAGGIALIAVAKEQGWTIAQLIEKANAIGVKLEQPHLQQFIQQAYKNEDTPG